MSDFGLLISRYNSSLPTLDDGAYSNLQVDVNGRLLVQADVSVTIDFLGLNSASDNANILIVGTEDGTSSGTAHAVRLTANGSVVIRALDFATDSVDVSGSTVTVTATDLDIRDLSASQDNVAISDGTDTLAINADGSINITDNGGSITVDAVNFDIRDLTHVSDSIKVGDGTDFLAINTDGSINTNATLSYAGAEEYNATDDLAAAADGEVTITASGTPWIDAAIIPVDAGETLHIYGMDFSCDQNAQARLITDDGVDLIVYKNALNSSAMPTVGLYWGDAGRIEIAGAANLEVKVQIKKRSQAGGNALGSSSIHARKLV